MELICDLLTFAFSANFSWDMPRIFRRAAIVIPSWINRSRFLNSTSLLMCIALSVFYLSLYFFLYLFAVFRIELLSYILSNFYEYRIYVLYIEQYKILFNR